VVVSIYSNSRIKSLQNAAAVFQKKSLEFEDFSILIKAVLEDPSNNFIKAVLYEKYPIVMHMGYSRQGEVFANSDDIPDILERILPCFPEGQALGDPSIMTDIREFLACYDAEKTHPNTVVTPHWDVKRSHVRDLVVNFKDPRSVVYFAQSHASGFDHRSLNSAAAKDIIDTKINGIRATTGVSPLFLDEISESPFSIPQGQFDINGKSYSTSLLWHARFFIGIWRGLENQKNIDVLEVGGGFGGLARLMLRTGNVNKYVIVDLPESIVSSYSFLKLNFPELQIQIAATPADVNEKQGADVLLVPSDYLDELKGREFDLGINTGSIQEMPKSSSDKYVSFFENDAKFKYFYSLNYSMIQHFRHGEMEQAVPEELNFVAPVLDRSWRVRLFYLNPPDILVDTPMNWLEVFLERDETSSDEILTVPDEKYSQEWFQAIWSNLWKAPSRELIEDYFEGIRVLFNEELDFPFNREKRSQFDNIGEVIYWRKFLEKQDDTKFV